MTTDGSVERPAHRRGRLLVAYDGALFHGFAANRGVRTVMGDLVAAVSTIVREPVELAGAGRTDAGVHGWGQVVTGDLPADTDLADLARRVNKLCGPAISVRAAEWAAPDFDARFSATSRRYRYHVWNDPAPHPLLAPTAWHVPRPLELATMQAATDPLIGQHDFAAFCRRAKVADGAPVPSTVRRITEIRWQRIDDSPFVGVDHDSPLLRMEIAATAFCHQMVRSIVGLCVDVGLGRRSAGEVSAILRSRDRANAGTVAPAHGLVLWEVGYDGRRWDAPADQLRGDDDDAAT